MMSPAFAVIRLSSPHVTILNQMWGYMRPNAKTCKCCKGQGTMADGTGCEDCNGTGMVKKAMPAPTEEQQSVIDALNQVLGDVALMYFHAHGYHWNVQGQDFSQYHALFASIYEDVYESIDPIAENILKLGGEAPRSLTDILNNASMNDQAETSNTPDALAADLAVDNDGVIASLNELFTVANAVNEQGVANFAAERIDQHQKWGWQLKASGDVSKGEKPVWDKPAPEDDEPSEMSDKQVAAAKARAKRAGRAYPNLVDNMAVSRKKNRKVQKMCDHGGMKIGKKCPDCGYIKKMGDVEKAGDKQGHSFRGNQYTRGKGSGNASKKSLKEQAEEHLARYKSMPYFPDKEIGAYTSVRVVDSRTSQKAMYLRRSAHDPNIHIVDVNGHQTQVVVKPGLSPQKIELDPDNQVRRNIKKMGDVSKGDKQGHPFRGNQYSKGKSSSTRGGSERSGSLDDDAAHGKEHGWKTDGKGTHVMRTGGHKYEVFNSGVIGYVMNAYGKRDALSAGHSSLKEAKQAAEDHANRRGEYSRSKRGRTVVQGTHITGVPKSRIGSGSVQREAKVKKNRQYLRSEFLGE